MISVSTDILAVNGGSPVRDIAAKPWSPWPVWDHTEEEALLDVLHSGSWWSVYGKHGKAFEQEFAEYQEAKFATNCTNGTAALVVALRALGIGCGDEVIVPPYTFVATAGCVVEVGAIPVFSDIDINTSNLDPEKIEEAITPRTSAIIPAHIAGRPCDMDRILEIARKRGIYVIEDAAQAHGATWRDKKVGALGDIGAFSFQASKNLNSGEGGIVLTNNEEFADAVWSVINVGRVRNGRWYEHPILGSNYRLGEFQAAILRAQMKRLPEQTQTRTKNANYLTKLLTEIPGIILPFDDPRITCHSYHLYTFRYDQSEFGGRSRDEFMKAMFAEGVEVDGGYVPLYKEGIFARYSSRKGTWCQTGRKIEYQNLSFPVCEQVCKDGIWLDQFQLLGERSDMEDIAEAITKIQRAWTR